jgi:hypothetical protein
MSFIDSLTIDKTGIQSPDAASKKAKENIFASHAGRPINLENTEYFFDDTSIGIKGVIDLAASSSLIVDYKTSKSRPSSSQIIASSLPQRIRDTVDIQPLLYLTEVRKLGSDQVSFWYYYCLANHRDVIDGSDYSHDKNTIAVSYIPQTFNEFLRDNPEYLCTVSKKCEQAAGRIGLDTLSSLFSKHPIPDGLLFDSYKLLKSSYHTSAVSFLKSENGNISEEDINTVLKSAVSVRAGKRFKPHFFKEDADAFEGFVADSLKEINTYYKTRFPCRPIGTDTCRNCEYAHMCLRDFEA